MTGLITPFFTPEEKTRRCIERHPDWADWKVAKSADVHAFAVRAIRAGLRVTPQSEASTPSGGNGNAALISLEKVIARYDIKAAILREIGELPKGKLIAEAELCQRTAGTDRNRFRRTVENNPDEFKPLRIKLRLDDGVEGKWFWANASDIAEAQKIVSL